MIHLENVYNVIQHTLNQYDQVWFITGDASEVKEYIDTHPQVVVHAELSPEQDLFRAYRERAKPGCWNRSAFDSFYVPHFLTDLSENQVGLSLLQDLKEQSSDQEIALACFCEDESMCHRSIIGGILLNMGASIDCAEDYRKYSFPVNAEKAEFTPYT